MRRRGLVEFKTRKIGNATTENISTLFHYQCYNDQHLADLLKTKRAWCSNIANVNDPWDCTMAFRIDDEETAKRTLAHLKSIARPSKGGPAVDAQLDWALENDPRVLPLVTGMVSQQGYEDAIEWRRLYCLTPNSYRKLCSTPPMRRFFHL